MEKEKQKKEVETDEKEERYLSESQFKKILEKSKTISKFNRYGMGYSKTRYLVSNAKGKLMELIDVEETDQRKTWTRRYIRFISPSEAIEVFGLSESDLKIGGE